MSNTTSSSSTMTSDIENPTNMTDVELAESPSNNSTFTKRDHTGKTQQDDDEVSVTHSMDEDFDLSSEDGDDDMKGSVPQRSRRVWGTAALFIIIVLALGLSLGLCARDKKAQPVSTSTAPSVPVELDEELQEEENAAVDSVTEAPVFDEDEYGTLEPVEDEIETPELTAEDFPEGAWEWPALVGVTGQEAKNLLEEYYPGEYFIVVLPDDATVTMDYDVYRIRIFVDKDTQLVSRTPMLG